MFKGGAIKKGDQTLKMGKGGRHAFLPVKKGVKK
jgi:hypothetical protein